MSIAIIPSNKLLEIMQSKSTLIVKKNAVASIKLIILLII